MDRDTYIVEFLDDRWALRLNGRMLAIFEDRMHAERAAGVALRMSQARGRTAEVSIRGEWNKNLVDPAVPTLTPEMEMEGLQPDLVSAAVCIPHAA